MLSTSELAAAQWVVVEHPARGAVFVTDGWVNSLTDAGGRRRLTTFAPYIGNLGYSPDERIADVAEIYCGGDAERSADLMRQYGATYVVDGGRPQPCDARSTSARRPRSSSRTTAARASGACTTRRPVAPRIAPMQEGAGAVVALEHVASATGRTARRPSTDLTLTVPAGEICVLVGPSGCGKTTTMKMVNRLIEPTEGRILIDGEDVTRSTPVELRRRIGYVIQQIGLFPHMTIAENVGDVPAAARLAEARIRERVDELLDLVGLEPAAYRDRYPAQLSGGQRQRVGVARALAADPPVLLMDEPFGAIDPIVRERLQNEFLRLQAQVRKTIMFVTHDIDEAIKLGDRIAILPRRAATWRSTTRRPRCSPPGVRLRRATSSAPTAA